MFGIGGFELFIILIFGFLIFGPDKLPEIARTVGKGIARFREAQQDMNDALGNDKIFDPDNPDEPFKDPIEALDKLAQRQEEKRKAKEGESGSAKGAAAKAETASASGDAEAGGDKPDTAADAARPESFTERKARYERERAARKAAEAQAAAEAAQSADRPAAADAAQGAEPAQPAAADAEPSAQPPVGAGHGSPSSPEGGDA